MSVIKTGARTKDRIPTLILMTMKWTLMPPTRMVKAVLTIMVKTTTNPIFPGRPTLTKSTVSRQLPMENRSMKP